MKNSLKSCIYGEDKWSGNIYFLDHEKRRRVMECILSQKDMPAQFESKTEKTLAARYADISAYFDAKKLDEKKLAAFICYFLERLVLVELGIQKDDTPMIFEVINDRGEALKPFEILKGKLVGALEKSDTDSYSKKWDTAIARLSGIEDAFFADYLKQRFVFKSNSEIEKNINNTYHRYIFQSNEIADTLQFRKSDKNQIENIKLFIENDLDYYSRLYAKIKNHKACDDCLSYLNEALKLSGQHQIILSACEIEDENEAEKISAIAKEYDRLFVLLILNGVYDSNKFQDISYSLNEKVKGLLPKDYRELFNQTIREAIKERKGVPQVSSILEYQNFLKADYANIEVSRLRYFLARVEKFICDGIGQKMQSDVVYIATKTGVKSGYHIEHILSHNETNQSYFANNEDFENKRNMLGGLLLLKGQDNISSGNEEYADKLKTYSAHLVWGHSLCPEFYHTNKKLDEFNKRLESECGCRLQPIEKFDGASLMQRCELLYNLAKLIWEAE